MVQQAKSKVILTEHLDDEPAAWLADRVRLVRQSHEDFAGLKRELADAVGLVVRTYTRVDDRLLDAAPRLKVIGRAGVGLDNIDLDACRRNDVRVVYTPDANTQAVVEYVWSLVLDAVRPRCSLDGWVSPPEFHRYRREHVGRQLDEMTLGILGMGRIGRRIAAVAHALGMDVLYHDLLSRAKLNLPADSPGKSVEPAALWAESDILTIHVDGRSENRHLIDGDVLRQLRRTCLLVNTSRGFVVDPVALASWAREAASDDPRNRGGAILDVHDPEPPPEDYPLFGIENVRLLPHLASRTHRAMANMSWVVRDVVRVLDDEEPRHAAV